MACAEKKLASCQSLPCLLFAALLVCSFLACMSAAEAGQQGNSAKNASSELPVQVQKNQYHALIIGNNLYRHFPRLKTAVNDATEVASLLQRRYGFKTRLLLNVTRKEILTTVNTYRKELGEQDNLLIYYAGHGEYDKTADKAYWLPVDAQKDDPVDWIMSDDITSNIKRMPAKHIVVISDSCYSGTLTRSAGVELKARGDRQAFLAKMIARPSRTLMASGGNEPVWDSGGGNHSVFAAAFLKALGEAEERVFTAEELFHGRLKEVVAGKSDQVPEYSNIKNSGHEGGDFVFYQTDMPQERPAPNTHAGGKPPEPSRFSIEDLQQQSRREETLKNAWQEKMNAMESALDQVNTYEKKEVSAELKAAAWMRLIESFSEDNPYSSRDDAIRKQARARAAYWKTEQSRTTHSKSSDALVARKEAPSSSAGKFEKPAFSVGDNWTYESEGIQEIRTYRLKDIRPDKYIFELVTVDDSGTQKTITKVFDKDLNDEDAVYPAYQFPFAPGDSWVRVFDYKPTGAGSFRGKAFCETKSAKSVSVAAGNFQDCVLVSCHAETFANIRTRFVSSSQYCHGAGTVTFTDNGRLFKLTRYQIMR